MKLLRYISSVQEDVAASGEIQGEEAAVFDGFSGAGVPWGCRRGRVVAYAYVQIAKSISTAICPILEEESDDFERLALIDCEELVSIV